MADDKRIDLARAAQLISALQQDLAKLSADSADLKRLRDEVETLKNLLNSPLPRHHWVGEGLHSIRHALDAAIAEGLKGGQYVAEIGRILGL